MRVGASPDDVLSRDSESGTPECKRIVRTYVHDADDVVRLSVTFGDVRTETFDVTLGHPFWVAGKGWTSVRDLVPGDVLSTGTGTEPVGVPLPGVWSRISVSDGTSARIVGEDFMTAVWSIWFGESDQPVMGDDLIAKL